MEEVQKPEEGGKDGVIPFRIGTTARLVGRRFADRSGGKSRTRGPLWKDSPEDKKNDPHHRGRVVEQPDAQESCDPVETFPRRGLIEVNDHEKRNGFGWAVRRREFNSVMNSIPGCGPGRFPVGGWLVRNRTSGTACGVNCWGRE